MKTNKVKLTSTRCTSCGDIMGGAKTYKKIATILAVQMNRDFVVRTLEGVMKGNKGDYLCEGTAGERWPIKKEIFEKTYVAIRE